jgi:hypothetical protein
MATRTDLSNIAVAEGYKQLIHVGDSTGIDSSTGRTLYDGDGTATDLELSGNSVNIKTRLKLNGSGVLATASELNQLDDVEFGGDDSQDVITVGSTQLINNKTIDGGTF